MRSCTPVSQLTPAETFCQDSATILQTACLASAPTGASLESSLLLDDDEGRKTRATAWAKHAVMRSEHNPHHASLSFSSTASGYSFAKTASRTRSAMLERQELASTFFTTPQSFKTRVSPTVGLAWLRLTGDEAEAGFTGLESAGLGLLGGKFGGGRKLMRTSATFVVSEGEVVKCPRPWVSCV